MRGFVFSEHGVVREFGRRAHAKESSRNNKATSLRYLDLQLNANFTAAYGQNLFPSRGTAGSLLITRSLFNHRVARKEMLARATPEWEQGQVDIKEDVGIAGETLLL